MRIIGFGVLALALCAVLQAAAPRLPDPALDRYGTPDRIVTLHDGRRIHIVCMGTLPKAGAPTVIFTAGRGDWAAAWGKVQPAVALQTRTCAWDRPGFGFSGPDLEPQTLGRLVDDLEQALKAAGIAGPYVLVSHSAGSFETLRFTDRHKRDVVGMVLVEPSLEDMDRRLRAISPSAADWMRNDLLAAAKTHRQCAAELRAEGARWKEKPVCLRQIPEVTPALKAVMDPIEREPSRMITRAESSEAFLRNTLEAINPQRDFGRIPMMILSADVPPIRALPTNGPDEVRAFDKLWYDNHAALAKLSRRGHQMVIPDTNHSLHMDAPGAVIAAIVEILNSARMARP